MNRKLKVYEQSMGGEQHSSTTILLNGKRFEEAGFKAGRVR